MAQWQSGHAADCKSVYPGSIPSCASTPLLSHTPMDDLVRAAMARWPDVPDIFGWLSLTQSGQWRLHPNGNALDTTDTGQYPAGESISNAQILGFINRNYTHDDHGRWFFQNGPQRVFVRLDAAPLILHTGEDGNRLTAHTGDDIARILQWWLDDTGHLYAQTDLGPGLVCGRDLMPVLEKLRTAQGQPLDQVLLTQQPPPQSLTLYDPFQGTPNNGTPLNFCDSANLETLMGFVRHPALRYA